MDAGGKELRRGLPYQPLVTVTIALASGIVLDRYGVAVIGSRLPSLSQTFSPAAERQLPFAFAAFWFAAAFCLIAWWRATRWHFEACAVVALLTSVAMLGGAWHHLRWHLFDRHEVARYAAFDSAPACILAVVRQSPELVPAPQPTPLRAIPGNERSRLTVNVIAVRDGTNWQPAAGVCELLVEGHMLGVHRGDRLRVFGQLARPRPPLNPGEFDFAAHARADRQLVRIRSSAPESVSVLARRGAWRLVDVLDSSRSMGKRLVREYVGPERASLASAVLLGARGGLPNEETMPFFVTGTIHLLVVSGLHVGILAMGLYWLMCMGWMSRRTSLAVIIGVVAAYALLAEARPPVIRAAVLIALMCIGAWSGRRAAAFNSLAAAALLVLFINPAELFRVGTQLSFLAVATLVWFHEQAAPWRFSSDPLERLIAASRPWYQQVVRSFFRWGLWLVLATLVVWLTALPLVLHQFHVATPVALLISPAIWILILLALWNGFAMLAFGVFIPPAASVLGTMCDWSLAGLENVVHWAESMPGGHFWTPGPALWWVVGFYSGIAAYVLWPRLQIAPRWQIAVVGAWIVLGFVPSSARLWLRDDLECSFVSVGHGACVVLEAPTGETLLYDAGALGAPEFATQTISAYLWHRGIRRIDGLIISHADIDHYNAVPGLLERFSIGAIYVSPMMFDGFGETNDGPSVLRAAIDAAGVPIREIWAGDRLRVGRELELEVLHPPRLGVVGSDNANSVTLAVEFRGRSVLLPGDLESPGLEDVIAELPYDCDILLAPHHGSRRSDPPGFAAWSTPEWVVISGGEGEEVRPVVETYAAAGANVLRTHEKGALRFSIRFDGINLAQWRDETEMTKAK